MTSLRKSIDAGFVLVYIFTFCLFSSTDLKASEPHKCSNHTTCNHGHLSTKGLAGFEYGGVLNFSKIISETEIASLVRLIPSNGREYRLRTVVLDAGHGGKDAGCSGKDSKEKNLTLEYVLALGNMIETKYPGIHVVYTRQKDEFVELYERANIANKSKADLFISIHCNWNPNASPYGTETYVLGLHRAKDNLEVAKRENSSIFLENNYEKNYDGFDPNSPEGNILLSMCQNAHLSQSISLAEKIEKEFAVKSQRKSRGVRQAGFLVLRATSMPAILVETGFLSNSNEEDYMTCTKGKKEIVQNIFTGFEKYKSAVEFSSGEPLANVKTKKVIPEPIQEKEEVITTIASDDDGKLDTEEVVAKVKEEDNRRKSAVTRPGIIDEDEQDEPDVKNNRITSNPKVDHDVADDKIEICVQLQVSKNVLDMSEDKWSEFQNVIARSESNMLKYQVVCRNMPEAAKIKTSARNNGFPEAFICAYRGGTRISLEELSDDGKMGSR